MKEYTQKKLVSEPVLPLAQIQKVQDLLVQASREAAKIQNPKEYILQVRDLEEAQLTIEKALQAVLKMRRQNQGIHFWNAGEGITNELLWRIEREHSDCGQVLIGTIPSKSSKKKVQEITVKYFDTQGVRHKAVLHVPIRPEQDYWKPAVEQWILDLEDPELPENTGKGQKKPGRKS